MPMYDFTCTSCLKTLEKIVSSYDTKTTTCPHCEGTADRVPGIMAPGSKRHVGVYFNYMVED
jgi:putative FmdB family regulatory protein